MTTFHRRSHRSWPLAVCLALVLASACAEDEPPALVVVPGSGGGSTSAGGSGGAPTEPSCTVDTCPDVDPSDCVVHACSDEQCQIGLAPEGSGCAVEGGGAGLCTTAGTCVECLANADCDNQDRCDAGRCVPQSCDDQILNGNETDVDCGGSCTRCGNGSSCNLHKDCLTWSCQNGACAACGTGADCPGDRFCANDGVCRLKKVKGLACQGDFQCFSGHCADGVCCDAACDGTCESCSLGFALGTCSAIPNLQDPDDECPMCTCNGARVCITFCPK